MGRGETAVGNRNEFKRKKAGFTLPEVLLVLGILTVLLALAVPGVLAIQANAKQTELDATAKQIFLAAQSVLTARQSSAEAGGIGGAVVEEQPSDFPDDLPWQQGEYFYVTQANAKQLLPMGSIDETVRRNYYVIEYCPSTGAIYGVFYAESEITYSASLPRTDRDARKSAKLGYYGGAGLDVSQSGQLQTPDFQVVNEDRLYVRLTAQEQTMLRKMDNAIEQYNLIHAYPISCARGAAVDYVESGDLPMIYNLLRIADDQMYAHKSKTRRGACPQAAQNPPDPTQP